MNYDHKVNIREEWITNGFNNDTINWSHGFGKFLAKKEDDSDNISNDQKFRKALSTSKLRKFFGAFKRIQADPQNRINELPMLKAYLAYDVGRDLKYDYKQKRDIPESRIADFHMEMTNAIDIVEKANEQKSKLNRFKNFANIVESIVAYHKFYGGKDS